MKKELYFDDIEKTNLNFYTFNLNQLSLTIAKLMTEVEGKEFVSVVFKSVPFGRSSHEVEENGFYKTIYHFAHIIIDKQYENKNFMDYYTRGSKPWLFRLAYKLDKQTGFVLHEEATKTQISENVTFKQHKLYTHEKKTLLYDPYYPKEETIQSIRYKEWDYNTQTLQALPIEFDYVIDFMNFVIINRIKDNINHLSYELLTNYLNDYLVLNLEEIREIKIMRLQEKITLLNQKINILIENKENYKDLNNTKVKRREK